jgi:LysR family transcriptional regulator, glycine cleavage system transcriptional activator
VARPLPSIGALRAVVAVVRKGSIVRAADALCLTPGAISRAIIDVERDLGFSLFDRSRRQIVATPIANELANALEMGMMALSRAFDDARAQNQKVRPLVLSCEPTFLIRWLIPRLAKLQHALGNDREVRLVSAGGPVEFARGGVDLAIRRADFRLDSTVHARPFLSERVGPVVGREADALISETKLSAVLLHTATRPQGWADWVEASGVRVSASRELRFEHFYQSLQAAVAGAGAAIGPIALVADDIAAGSLKAPFGFRADGSEYVLLNSAEQGDSEAFNTVHDWLTTAVAPIDLL